MIYIALTLAHLLLTIALHESAHVATAAIFRIKIKRAFLCWKGFAVVRESGAPFDNMIVSLSGPIINLFFAAVLWGMPGWATESFMLMNLCYGVANLLPFKDSDGSRALECWRVIERSPEEIRTEQIRVGGRGTGRTDMQIKQAIKWLQENKTGVLQLWSISQESATAMYQRLRLAGADTSRIRISISGEEQFYAETSDHFQANPMALHRRTS